MGRTVEALGYKANVPARTRDWVGEKKDAVSGRVSGVAPDGQAVRERSLRMKDTAERNPLGLAVAGAAVGFIAGILAPSTRVENEKLGPAADQVKEQADDAGKEALDHGKQVAQAAAQSAVETAKDEGRRHGEELNESLQDRARAASPDAAG
jgi:gas vesicle protein